MMKNILKLNAIEGGIDKIFADGYNLTNKCQAPDAILLRSFDLHTYPLNEELLCIGRAGAGVNNIPVEECSKKGIVVFNTPGANANAVKELTLCALFLAARDIHEGIDWAQALSGDDIESRVESGKKAFSGGEIFNKKLGVVGLGAIGQLVANAAVRLGMDVYGYDPFISVDAAWNLNHNITKKTDIKEIFSQCDYITLHIPFNENTKHTVNADTLSLCKDGVCIINCSRAELVDDDSLLNALCEKRVKKYVTDFPNQKLIGRKGVITIPHLGASTLEAEDNCAAAVARQVIDYIENGNVKNSVNFPPCSLCKSGKSRLTVFHKNVKKVLNSITDLIANEGVNIENFMSQSRGEYAYAIIDMAEELNKEVINKISGLDNIIKIRVL